MQVERLLASHSHLDVLERVLDRGIVIDISPRISVLGIELVSIEAGLVVASIEIHVLHEDLIRYSAAGDVSGGYLNEPSS